MSIHNTNASLERNWNSTTFLLYINIPNVVGPIISVLKGLFALGFCKQHNSEQFHEVKRQINVISWVTVLDKIAAIGWRKLGQNSWKIG